MDLIGNLTIILVHAIVAGFILWYVTKEDIRELREDVSKNGWKPEAFILPYGMGVIPTPQKKSFVIPSRTKKRHKRRK